MLEVPSWVAVAVLGGAMSWAAYVTRLAFVNRGDQQVATTATDHLAEQVTKLTSTVLHLANQQGDSAVAVAGLVAAVDALTDKVASGFEQNDDAHGSLLAGISSADAKTDRHLETVTHRFSDFEARLAVLEQQVAGHHGPWARAEGS